MIWRTGKYLQHQLYLRRRRGFGIHSPYLYAFLDQVLYNAQGWEVPANVTALHRSLKTDRTPLGADAPGAGSRAGFLAVRRREFTRGGFVRRASVSGKYGALLHRTARWFSPEAMLETGTGLGISSLYLGSGAPGVPLHTIEGAPERARLSAGLHLRAGLARVVVHTDQLEPGLRKVLADLEQHDDYHGRMLAFVDADHRFGPTLEVVRALLEHTGDEAIVVLDDIYWSEGMYHAWAEIIRWPQIRISIDLFRMGILLLRRDLHKSHLKLNF